MDLELEAVKRVKLREERCWTALIEGNGSFSGKNNKKKEQGERECERKRTWEEACDLDTFCWLVFKRHHHQQCLFFTIDSEEEGSENGEAC